MDRKKGKAVATQAWRGLVANSRFFCAVCCQLVATYTTLEGTTRPPPCKKHAKRGMPRVTHNTLLPQMGGLFHLTLLFATIFMVRSLKTAGFDYVAEGFEGPFPYDAPESLASIDAALAVGINTFALSFPWYIPSAHSTGPIYPVAGGVPSGAPFNNASSPSNASIITAIRAIHSKGMAVVLRPLLDPHWNATQKGDSTWRGAIGTSPPFTPAQWDDFFSSYSAFILYFAGLAEQEHVETLCIGAELYSTEHLSDHWRALFASVRAVFKGTVYYSSTGSDVDWWDASDFIAQDMYPQLTNSTANPDSVSVDDLVAAWGPSLLHYQQMSQRHNKTVLVQETGICSVFRLGIYSQPAFFECYGLPIDESVQAKYYDAILQAVLPQEWIEGVTFWKWGAQGGPNDPTFFPLNKSTMGVIEKHLHPKK